MNKNWKEAQERSIALPEDDVNTFHTYVQWLYTGKIPCQTDRRPLGYLALARLYGFGEKVIDKTLKDTVLDAIVACTFQANEQGHRTFPMKDTVKTIYKSTSVGSPARRLMVDMYLAHGNEQMVSEKSHLNHKAFLQDLSRALLKERVLPDNAKRKFSQLMSGTPCSYHQHGEDEPCNSQYPHRKVVVLKLKPTTQAEQRRVLSLIGWVRRAALWTLTCSRCSPPDWPF